MTKIWEQERVINHSKLLLSSFTNLFQKELIEIADSDLENSFRLFHAPFIVVSHGIEKDPIFNYANAKALTTWEMEWSEFVGLPSRFSVERRETEDREKLLAEAQSKGYVNNYVGIRISKTGKRFFIKNTILYNLKDDSGNYAGQAAVIPEIEYLQ